MCEHSGFWSCVMRYDHAERRLDHVMVCDDCHLDMKRIGEQGYEPKPLVSQDPSCPPLAA